MNLVLFLGAGFSKAYGLPVMQEFFNHAKNAPYLKNEDKEFLDTYQRKTHSAANMFDPDYGNLEDVLSFCLVSENFAGKYPEETSDDYKRLCRILYEVYRHVLEYDLAYWNLPKGHLQNILRIPKHPQKLPYNLTVVTTNYDIIAEYTFWRMRRILYLPNEWEERKFSHQLSGNVIDGMYTPKIKGNPLLCKLHGSLNWSSSGTQSLIVEGRIIAKDVDAEPKLMHVNSPLIAEMDYLPIETPLIVPPTIFKLQVDPCLQSIWDAAGASLREADNLVFIGFSFPKSDMYIRYFLTANLFENNHLDKISIVDPEADKICQRLKEPGSKFGRRFQELLVPYNYRWFDAQTAKIF